MLVFVALLFVFGLGSAHVPHLATSGAITATRARQQGGLW